LFKVAWGKAGEVVVGRKKKHGFSNGRKLMEMEERKATKEGVLTAVEGERGGKRTCASRSSGEKKGVDQKGRKGGGNLKKFCAVVKKRGGGWKFGKGNVMGRGGGLEGSIMRFQRHR